MRDLWLIGLSFVYIFAVIGISSLLFRNREGEASRKFVHIMVGNWIFISHWYEGVWAALFVPLVFVVINGISLKYNLISTMERKDDSLGTVFYAISLAAAVGLRFATGWTVFPMIGILIMAYGDGFAALVGKRWGKIHPFSFAPEKTLAGSAVVVFVGIVVTAASLFLLGEAAILERVGVTGVLWIALLTGLLSAFIEAAGKRGCDNLTLPLGAAMFASLAFYYGDLSFYLYILASAGILWYGLLRRWLTADGVVAAILTAATLHALGGLWIALGLHAFYLLGSYVSKIRNERKREAERCQEGSGARNWVQVVCNSLPACVLVWCRYFFTDHAQIFSLLAYGIFAAAAADTFSSEIGMLSRSEVFSILTGRRMRRGVSGGVSWFGLLAGGVGGFLLSLLAWPDFGFRGVLFVTAMGLVGTLIDSVLGALVQRKYRAEDGELSDKPSCVGELPVRGFRWISNNSVNLISLCIVAVFGVVLNQWLGIAS